jgi:site-specific DNA recombinase
VRALLAEPARRLPPPLRPDAKLLAQQRHGDLRLVRGDYSGLNLACLVRLSFEADYGAEEEHTKSKQPRVIMTGADINGREDQDDRCKRSIEALGGNYVFTYDEPNTSAWKRRKVKVVINDEETVEWRVVRPVYEGALKDLKRGVAPNGKQLDGLIVYDLDRLTRDLRNLQDATDVVQHYAKLITDINRTIDLFTDTGISNATFLVTAKRMSSDDTSRRVTDKHHTIAQAGIPVGGSRPFGWNEDKRTLHPVESALMRKARADVLAGVGLHTICREWNEAGIRTPRGKEWVRTVLRNVLVSPRLAGYRVYQGGICRDHDGNPVMGQYTPILEIAEWEDVRDHLTRDGRYAAVVHRGGLKYLLSSIMRCGLCGAKCLAFGDRRNARHYYSCPSPTTSRGCGKVSINGAKLDVMVTERVRVTIVMREGVSTAAVSAELSILVHNARGGRTAVTRDAAVAAA